ncbi:DUF6160 family protein [Pseudomonas sp. 2FE]|uniref:DUF6160 family protein n=1 Tax=Pseudomonas sp. 2FE TaxID=2502190 RepID=UPI0010F7703B|nr:DUF6160 family protein [Pseudomonas sp. 2FE]
MRPTLRLAKLLLAGLCASLLTAPAQAALVEMADGELSEVTGQAFINLTTNSNAGIDYTRINLGMKVETQLNMNKLQLGLYPRSGEAANTADIDINNFALGTVNDAAGTVNPFMINDPFIELAYSGNKIVGVRVGFAESKGTLSGDINNLTGSVPVHIKGNAGPVYDNASGWTQFLLGLAGVYRSSTLEADAELVTGLDTPNPGVLDPIRANYTGMPEGSTLNCTSGCLPLSNALLGLFTSTNCAVSGVTTCFPLTQFQSLPVGNSAIADNPATQTIEGAAKGFFISMQSQAVAWQDMDSGAFKTALAGAYLNLPKFKDANGNLVAPINVDFNMALTGIPRADTCFGTATKGC